jgi:hypothetical protein
MSGPSIETRCKEHSQTDKSAVVEHTNESGHRVEFRETEILAKISGYMDQLVKEATEIILHSNIIEESG